MSVLSAMLVTAASVLASVLLVEHGAARWAGRWGMGELAVTVLVLAVLVGAAMCSAGALVGASPVKTTRQGVRDLGSNDRSLELADLRLFKQCDHKRIDWCCAPKNCGHWLCPDCDLAYDEGGDAYYEEDAYYE